LLVISEDLMLSGFLMSMATPVRLMLNR
jgi:hypothetical protein